MLRPIGLLSLLLVTACASTPNTVRANYKSSLERWPSGEVSRLVAAEGKTQILTSKNAEDDATRMMEAGYLLLGRSKFQTPEMDPAAARDAAADLGASVVLVKVEHAKTVTEAVPVDRWMPRSAAPAPAEHGVGKTIQGEFRTTYVQRPVDYFDYSATFWAKSKPPIFGVLVEGVETKQPERTVQVPGVVVRAVIADSPAKQAGILKSDLIIRFGGTPITGADQFFETVVAKKGQEVEVEVVRTSEGASVVKAKVALRNE